jgi:hypothetical protein
MHLPALLSQSRMLRIIVMRMLNTWILLSTPPITIETKKNPTKTNINVFYHPSRTNLPKFVSEHAPELIMTLDAVARNLFGIDYCCDHPNTSKVEFENAWKFVEANKGKKAVSPVLIIMIPLASLTVSHSSMSRSVGITKLTHSNLT